MGNRSIYDAALVLRNVNDADETADANEAGLAVDFLALYHTQHKGVDNAAYDFKAVIHNIAVGGSVPPTSVDFIIEVAATSDFASGEKEIGRVRWDGVSKQLEIPLSTYVARKLHADPKAIRIKMDLTGGTSPTVDYGAYLTKN